VIKRSLLWVAALGVMQVHAWQCQPMSAVVAGSPIVFIGQPRVLLRRGALLAPEPRLAGTPARYDLVRFAVVGSYRGASIGATFDLLCPADEVRCSTGIEREHRYLLIALPAAPTAADPRSVLCRMVDAQARDDPNDPDAPRLRVVLDAMTKG